MSSIFNLSTLPTAPDMPDYPPDTEISTFSRFLFWSTTASGHRLQHPRCSVDGVSAFAPSRVNGPLPGSAGFERSRTVFDALVSICISGATQTLALSVTIGSTVRICLAENNIKPQPSVKLHLQSIWQQLNALATLQKRLRSENGLPDVIASDGKSPKDSDSHWPHGNPGFSGPGYQELKQLKMTFNRDIHKFCYFKTKNKIEKYLSGLPIFYKDYKNMTTLDENGDLTVAVYYLHEIYRTVMENKEPLDSAGIPMLDWHYLVTCFGLLLHEYTTNKLIILDRGRSCMTYWGRLSHTKKDRTLRGFDLPRAIQKLVTLSSHIQQLIKFAFSPRLCSMLEKDLEVVVLDPIVVTLPEPSVSDMESAVRRAFAMTEHVESRRDLDDLAIELDDTLIKQLNLVPVALSTPVPSIGVHAEYTLLIHHHREAEAQSSNQHFNPPFQYIAVNKLSCFSCWSIYKHYAIATKRTFLLRGSHSKLYFPWWAATEHFETRVAGALRKGLYRSLVQLYSSHLDQLGSSHSRLSNSTAASGESGHVGMLPDYDDTLKGKEVAMMEMKR